MRREISKCAPHKRRVGEGRRRRSGDLAGGEVVDAGLQLFGGSGFMNECEIARPWRDAGVQGTVAGSSEVMREIIGRSMEFA